MPVKTLTISGLVIGYLTSASDPVANARMCVTAGGNSVVPRPYEVG